MASGGSDSRGRTSIPSSWKKFCIVLNGKSEDASLVPFCIQFLLDKHAENVFQTLKAQKFSDIQILQEEQSLSLKYDTRAQDEDDIMHNLNAILEKKVEQCQHQNVVVPKDKISILSECDLPDSSGDVGVYFDKLKRDIKIVSFDRDQVERIVQWFSDNLKSDSADNSSVSHRLSITWEAYTELDTLGFFDDCDEKIKNMRKNVHTRRDDELVYMYGKNIDVLYLDEELKKICAGVKSVEFEIVHSEGEVLCFPEGKAYADTKLLQENIKNILWKISRKQTLLYLQIKAKSDELIEKASQVIKSSVSSILVSDEMQQSAEFQKLRELHQSKQLVISGLCCHATSDVIEKLERLKQMKRSKKLKDVEFPIDYCKALLLQKKNARDYVEKELMDAGISSQFHVVVNQKSENILRFAESEVDAKKVYSLIVENLKIFQYSNTGDISNNAGWRELEVKHKDKWFVDDIEGEEFTVCCTADIEDEVKNVVDKMMEEKCVEMKVDDHKFRFVKEKLPDKLLNIATSNDVKISTDNCHFVTIAGEGVKPMQARRDLEKLLQNIEICKVGDIRGVIDLILKEDKVDGDIQSILEENCDVFVQEELKEVQPHHLRDWVELNWPFHICVLTGSPTKTIADMIVLPTNDSYYPVEDGRQIFLDGADEILKDISSGQKNRKRYGLGDCFIFKNTGNLKFQYIGCLCTTVNSAVGSNTSSSVDLCRWIVNLLQEADKNGIQSVVIPIQLTHSLIAEVQMEEIAKALKQISSMFSITSLHEVYVCVAEEKSNEEIMKVFENELKDLLECDFHCLVPSQRNQIDEKDQKSPIHIEVVEGHIEKQEVDVIVNAVSHDLDLSVGVISRKILKIAGGDLQRELFMKSPLKIGDCVHSKSWNMQTCKALCHVALSDWTPFTDFSLRVVKLVMWQCLWYGHRSGFSSIAFPALGCGKQKYPPSSLATIMMECVEEFGVEHPDTPLKAVSFVIFPEDRHVLQWFSVAQRKCSQSVSSYPELPKRILEWRKSTSNGTVKIKTITIDTGDDSRIFRSCGCDAIFHFRPRKPDDTKDFLYDWKDDGPVGTAVIDNNDPKNSSEERLRGIWSTASQNRLTSVAICTRDLSQAGWNDVENQLLMVRDTFLRTTQQNKRMYIQEIWVVMTEGEHLKLLEKVGESQKQKWNYTKLWSTAKNVFYSSISDWKITKPTYNRMKSEKLVALMLVGEKEQVKLVKMKIKELEKRLPETEQEHWKYIQPVGNYTEATDLPKEICRKLSIARILEKDCVTLRMNSDAPFCFDLKKMRCGPKIGEIKYDLKRENHQDAASGKIQEVQLFDDIEIFEKVTGDINHCFAHDNNFMSVKEVLVGCELKLEESTKATVPFLQVEGSFGEILKANEILRNELPVFDGQSSSRQRVNTTSSDGFENIDSRKIDAIYYGAMKFFFHDDEIWKTLDVHWKDGNLLFCNKKSDDEKHIDNLIARVLAMKREDILIPSHDKIESIKKLCDDKQDIYSYFDDTKSSVTIFGENYEHFLGLQQQITFQLQEAKPSSRRNRFAADQSQSKSRAQRFAVTEKEEDFESPNPLSGAPASDNVSVTEFFTKENIKIKVYCASILSLDVDCIVNAANEKLAHGAGVAAVISNAAGYTLDQEGNNYIQKNGPLRVGTCCATTAGKLTRYKCVIHTVGPRWYDYRNKNECREVLKRSIYVCLQEATNQGLSSIGIPSISAGIFGVPKEVCAAEYFYAITEFSKYKAQETTLKEIHFIDRDDQMIGLIKRVFQSGFDGKLPPADQSDWNRSISSKSVSAKTQSFQKKTSGSSSVDHCIYVNDEQIKIHVLKRDIMSLAVDGIVCPQDMEFSGRSQIAKTVYNKAGEQYKTDLDKMEWRPLMGEEKTFDTYGSLPFKYVVHVVIPIWFKTRNATYEGKLEKAMQSIFKVADIKKMKSLAIPLLGINSESVDETTKIFGKSLKKCISSLDRSAIEDIYVVCIEDTGYAITIIQSLFREDEHFREEKFGNHSRISNARSLETTLQHESDGKLDCCICMDTCTEPKELGCGHVFCTECIDTHFTYKPTCPSCNQVFGKLYGNQPNGSIRFMRHTSHLPGYYRCGTIEVMYHIYSGTQQEGHPNPGKPFEAIRRSGLLPDNKDGRIVAKLLNVAFTRKLTFTIGRSRTTDKEGVVTWNDIHHKTRREGGPERFGYPDPTYLSRVLEELSVKGVTEETADDPSEYKEYTMIIY